MRKYIIALALMVLGAGILFSAAEAHTPAIHSSCEGLSWDFKFYEHANATVIIDGNVVASEEDF